MSFTLLCHAEFGFNNNSYVFYDFTGSRTFSLHIILKITADTCICQNLSNLFNGSSASLKIEFRMLIRSDNTLIGLAIHIKSFLKMSGEYRVLKIEWRIFKLSDFVWRGHNSRIISMSVH